mmetsp:Transcript_37067/g.57956  ORF Transcript_37067/g.57956 Transcript_37067/m.57956 type:complete len:135 (+) Transcript_37067:52-456(+)|eukprot:CAMPEP_0184306728 /NCGR_PEP_ID=MMETSP1049-20130417/15654_1 /TAXON_ID=77928 /ORGANISM="Proteomonas sulcata, Strain CCMP704" /LENGTH=134 /DNA_ID=CAMNT_0026619055 /DNA_START=29 /DNA_END=433 /DNA_ORIENTATION=-
MSSTTAHQPLVIESPTLGLQRFRSLATTHQTALQSSNKDVDLLMIPTSTWRAKGGGVASGSWSSCMAPSWVGSHLQGVMGARDCHGTRGIVGLALRRLPGVMDLLGSQCLRISLELMLCVIRGEDLGRQLACRP